jgi:hypothetical protein
VSKVKGKTREEIINNLAERIDKFEQYAAPHSQAMADMALHMANRLGLSQADAKAIAEAARLHDIGLYAMAPTYYANPAALRFEQRLDLWRHSIIGEQEMAKREASRYAQLLVRWHHEWWNGSGYPDMLSFEDIPIGARILRAVELYNALTAARPYREALPAKEALEALQSSAGFECDPYVVHALLALLEEMNAGVEPEPTVFADDAINTEKLAELQTEDSIDTAKLTRQPLDQPFIAADTERQHPELAQQNLSTPLEPATENQANRPARVQETASPVETNPSSGIWANPADGGTTPSYSVWSAPQSSIQNPAPAANQPAASESPSAVNDSFLQSANPLDALLGETPAESPTHQTAPTETPQPQTSLAAPPPAEASTPSTGAPQAEPPSTPAQASVTQAALPQRLFRTEPKVVEMDDSPVWLGWKAGTYNKKSLLAFEASVLRQIQFTSVAIPFSAEAKLDWYLKAWNKRILSNDSRAWAATAARALIESTEALSEENIVQLLKDIYVPGTRLGNPHLRRWFSETDAWWMDNLRRNIELIEDEKLRAQACLLGLQTGDYALSFEEQTYDLRRPLATVFWRLAGRFTIGAQPHPQNRSYNYQPLEFIRNGRADLLYLNLPASDEEAEGVQARFQWRECWVKGMAADAADFARTLPAPQSKQAYLLRVDKMLRAAAHIKKWAIGCQEIGLVSAREINDLVKEHRNVRATYSKDVTEVAGGTRSYIIVAERE